MSKSIQPGPAPEGYREAGVTDPQGNQWWIARKTENYHRRRSRKEWMT